MKGIIITLSFIEINLVHIACLWSFPKDPKIHNSQSVLHKGVLKYEKNKKAKAS